MNHQSQFERTIVVLFLSSVNRSIWLFAAESGTRNYGAMWCNVVSTSFFSKNTQFLKSVQFSRWLYFYERLKKKHFFCYFSSRCIRKNLKSYQYTNILNISTILKYMIIISVWGRICVSIVLAKKTKTLFTYIWHVFMILIIKIHACPYESLLKKFIEWRRYYHGILFAVQTFITSILKCLGIIGVEPFIL